MLDHHALGMEDRVAEKERILTEEETGFIIYENGTERHFTHNITGPAYLYENKTIYYTSNLREVFPD